MLQIQVYDAIEKDKFILYEMRVSVNDEKWIVKRRFREFYALHQILRRQLNHSACVNEVKEKSQLDFDNDNDANRILENDIRFPKFPKKEILKRHSKGETTVKRRIQELDEYMQAIISHPTIIASPPHELVKFLGMMEDHSLCISIDSIEKFVHTGAIVFFRCVNRVASIQRKITSSSWDHVGIVIRRFYYPELLEATGSGVLLTPLVNRLRDYISYGFASEIAIRNITIDDDSKNLLVGFARKSEGKPYELKLFSSNGDSYFCSELVADAFVHAKLLNAGKRKPCSFWPVSFKPGGTIDKYMTCLHSEVYRIVFEPTPCGLIQKNDDKEV